MNLDTLELAKKLVSEIKDSKEQLKKMTKLQPGRFNLGLNNTYLKVPNELVDTFLTLIESQYTKNIKKLEKELDNL